MIDWRLWPETSSVTNPERKLTRLVVRQGRVHSHTLDERQHIVRFRHLNMTLENNVIKVTTKYYEENIII